MTQSRLDKLNSSLQTSDLDAVILNPGPTLTHLTGLHFHLMERPVVLMFAKDQEPAIVLPELELQKVASLPYKLQVFAYPENPSEWGWCVPPSCASPQPGGEAYRSRTAPAAPA